jgi:hypothetical protein
MVFCSIDVGARGKVPFVAIGYWTVLKHECHEGTNGTNLLQNDGAVVPLLGVGGRCYSDLTAKAPRTQRKEYKNFASFAS